mmetsp:Transcript_34537/g.38801  ORF Transcript_34537/g.38801 Transcript_34537/m.38801 type:complete len:109 (-) Transcript_34537:155-481(-)
MKKVLSLALLLLPSQLITVECFTTSVRAVPSAFITTTAAAAGSSSLSSIQLNHHLGDTDIEHYHDYDTSIDNNNNNNNNDDDDDDDDGYGYGCGRYGYDGYDDEESSS